MGMVDEDLLREKQGMEIRLKEALKTRQLNEVVILDNNETVERSSIPVAYDSLYSQEQFDSTELERINKRVLRSNILSGNESYLITIRVSLVETEDMLQSIVTVQAILLLLLLGGLFLINRNLAKRIWKPFNNTLSKLHQYKVDQKENLQLEPTTVDEFSGLNDVLKELTFRAGQAYYLQKEFTENAAHELQTPLAIFKNKVEMLMQTNPLSSEQASLIEQLAAATERMVRLNRSLILLSKIENNQFQDIEEVSIGEQVRLFIHDHEEQLMEKQISMTVIPGTSFNVSANKALIEILISNLIGNAIRHNVPGGKVIASSGSSWLKIENTGKDKPIDISRIFGRFQKDSTDENSIGLGLEIVRKIATAYGFEINYAFQTGLHQFILSKEN